MHRRSHAQWCITTPTCEQVCVYLVSFMVIINLALSACGMCYCWPLCVRVCVGGGRSNLNGSGIKGEEGGAQLASRLSIWCSYMVLM